LKQAPLVLALISFLVPCRQENMASASNAALHGEMEQLVQELRSNFDQVSGRSLELA
jgi:hypothetical protein